MGLENPQRISVIDPIGPAIEHVRLMLFKPFDLSKWLIIGFCAWLANLVRAAAVAAAATDGKSMATRPDIGSYKKRHTRSSGSNNFRCGDSHPDNHNYSGGSLLASKQGTVYVCPLRRGQ